MTPKSDYPAAPAAGVLVPTGERHAVATLLAVLLGFFVIKPETVVVNVALPTLGPLSANLDVLQWVVDGYTLMFGRLLLSACVLPIGSARVWAGLGYFPPSLDGLWCRTRVGGAGIAGLALELLHQPTGRTVDACVLGAHTGLPIPPNPLLMLWGSLRLPSP